VLLPSWYSSDYHGYDFLIGPGRALDPATFFIVAAEMFASGNGSSPSNTHAGWMFSRSYRPRESHKRTFVAVENGVVKASNERATT
jgi:homoserine acetyltransferase